MSQKDEIHVEGRVHLGEILELEEIEPPGEAFEYDIDYAEGSLLPGALRSPVWYPSASRSKREDFVHKLQRSGQQLFLVDDGLLLQYGILGGPGSGKTNLLTYLLRQLVSLHADRGTHKFGGIILDPKAALINDVRKAFQEAGRDQDLVVINSRELRESGGLNLIDCMLAPNDLGKTLVLAAQSTGVAGREPFWNLQMSNAFGAILYLLEFLHGRKPTLKEMMDTTLGSARDKKEGNGQEAKAPPGDMRYNRSQQGPRAGVQEKPGTLLDKLIAEVTTKLQQDEAVATKKLQQAEAEKAVEQLNSARTELENLQDPVIRAEVLSRHGQADPKNRITVEQFIEKAYGLFRDSAFKCYSTPNAATAKIPGTTASNLYDQVVNEGKVILVSPAPQELELSSILPALVKLIFQRVVGSRFERFREGPITNKVRPLLFMADEYHMVATQIEGEPVGDGQYFSTARQFGGLCLVATQTVHQLESSGLKETWEAVFGTLAAVIGMKQQDPDTIEYLQKRGGKKDVLQTTKGYSIAKGDVTVSESSQRIEVPEIPATGLRAFCQGNAVVIGTTTDHKKPSTIRYMHVPEVGK
jgi:hypothetical protein